MKRFLWLIVGFLGCGVSVDAVQINLDIVEGHLFQTPGIPSSGDYSWALDNDLSTKISLASSGGLPLLNPSGEPIQYEPIWWPVPTGDADLLGFGNDFSSSGSTTPVSTGASSFAELNDLFGPSSQLPQPSSPALSRAASTELGGEDDYFSGAESLFGDGDEEDYFGGSGVVREAPFAGPSNFEEMLETVANVKRHDSEAIEGMQEIVDGVDPNNLAYLEFFAGELGNVGYNDLLGMGLEDKSGVVRRPDLVSQYGLAKAILSDDVGVDAIWRAVESGRGGQAMANILVNNPQIVTRSNMRTGPAPVDSRPSTAAVSTLDSAAGFFDRSEPQNEAEAIFNQPLDQSYVDPFAAVGDGAGEFAGMFGSDESLPAAPEAGSGEIDWNADGALDEL